MSLTFAAQCNHVIPSYLLNFNIGFFYEEKNLILSELTYKKKLIRN